VSGCSTAFLYHFFSFLSSLGFFPGQSNSFIPAGFTAGNSTYPVVSRSLSNFTWPVSWW